MTSLLCVIFVRPYCDIFFHSFTTFTRHRQSKVAPCISKFDPEIPKRYKVTDLGCQVEAQITATRQVVLNQQRNLARQANLDLARQGSSLAEVDEVLEGESQRHGLRKLNVDVELRLLDVGVAAEGDGAVANIAIA